MAGELDQDEARDRADARTDRRTFLSRAAVGAAAAGVLVGGPTIATAAKVAGRGASPTAFDRSLGGNITKVLFLTINVSDLDRAVDFYERTYPVTRAETIEMDPQPMLGLGIKRGRFRARMMRDAQAYQGRGILLVQWLDPTPVGTPYRSANHTGYYRHHASATRTGLKAAYERVVAGGGRPYGPPTSIEIMPGYSIYAFGFRDPDGTTLEWVGPMDPTPNGAADNLTAFNANCRNLPASHRWYREVLGLNYTTRLNPVKAQPATNGSLGDSLQNRDGSQYTGLVDFDATILSPWADGRNGVDLLEWEQPPTYGRPYARANNLGTQSVTYEVNNVRQVHDKLMAILPRPRAHIVHRPEYWNLGQLGRRKVLNILDPDGIRIQFMEKVTNTPDDPR